MGPTRAIVPLFHSFIHTKHKAIRRIGAPATAVATATNVTSLHY